MNRDFLGGPVVKTLLVRKLRSRMLCSVSEKKKKLCVSLFEPSPMAPVKLVSLRTHGSLWGHRTGLPSSPQAGVLNKAVASPSVLMRFHLVGFIHASRPLESHGSQSLSPSKRSIPPRLEYI